MDDDAHDSEAAADELVLRARSDRDAFGRLYDRYYPRVLRYCLRRLSDRAAAEDVTSEAFLNVVAHLGDFQGTTETDFRRWLFRIATNAVNAQLRKLLRRQEIFESAARSGQLRPPDPQGTQPPAEDAIDWQAIHESLLELELRDQAIVSLRFFAGLTHDEIAAVLDSTAGAVRTALSRTLSRLRERLKERDPHRRDA